MPSHDAADRYCCDLRHPDILRTLPAKATSSAVIEDAFRERSIAHYAADFPCEQNSADIGVSRIVLWCSRLRERTSLCNGWHAGDSDPGTTK
jgi:hypothetical protein